MKRTLFRLFAAGAAALALAGCAGVDLGMLGETGVKVAETLTEESTSTAKGVTAGMSSSDAANVIMTREYYSAIKAIHGVSKEPAPPLVEIIPNDGKPIMIDAKVFRVNAPRSGGGGAVQIAEPQQVESTGFKISREARAWLFGLLGWDADKDREKTRRLIVQTDAETQRFVTTENNQLMRDLVGTKNDPAAKDRADAEKVRAEADRIRSQGTTPAATN